MADPEKKPSFKQRLYDWATTLPEEEAQKLLEKEILIRKRQYGERLEEPTVPWESLPNAEHSLSLEEWINSPEMQKRLAEEHESLQPPVPEHLRPRQRHFMDRKYTRELAEQAARNALPEEKLAPRHSTELKPDESLPPEEK